MNRMSGTDADAAARRRTIGVGRKTELRDDESPEIFWKVPACRTANARREADVRQGRFAQRTLHDFSTPALKATPGALDHFFNEV
jgi:hypothetical protein